jgi:spermidine synthase
MFTAGFTASSVEIMGMVIFQVMFGYLYQALALFLAAFMAGLAAGSVLGQKKFNMAIQQNFLLNQGLIGISALVLPGIVILWEMLHLPAIIVSMMLYLIIAFSGLITGLQFSWSNALARGSTGMRASGVYSADLAGSAGGAIITAIVLIPLAGIIYTGFILLGLNILTFLWLLVFRKSVF